MQPPVLPITVMLAVVVGGALSLQARQSTSAAGQEQLVGTWALNVERSRYVPGPGPVSETRTYTRGPNGLEGAIRRRFSDGRSDRIEYVAEYDRLYPVAGTTEYDHVLLKRIDAYTAEAVLSHAGRVYGVARRVISADGKTMTITFRREAGQGSTIINTAVYEKLE